MLDTGSRGAAAGRGRRADRGAHARAARADQRAGTSASTPALRGNVGAELAALAAALGRPLVIAAAAPSLGITTAGGLQRLGDAPVDRRTSRSAPTGRAARASPRCCRARSSCRSPPCAATRSAKRCCITPPPAGMWSATPTTAADLAGIAHALAGRELRDRVCPSAATAWRARGRWRSGFRRGCRARPVLAAVSSLKPASREQVDVAAARGAHVLFEAARCDLAPAAASLAAGRDVVLVAGAAGGAPARAAPRPPPSWHGGSCGWPRVRHRGADRRRRRPRVGVPRVGRRLPRAWSPRRGPPRR